MQIVLTALTLGTPGGMQSYLLAVAPQLERLGHQVTLYAPEQGTMAEVARSRGLRVARQEDDLPASCDAVFSQDAVTAVATAGRYPGAVRIIVVHSAEFDVHLPPGLDGVVHGAVALNDAVARRLSALALALPVTRLRQPIDTDRLRAVGVASERPGKVLLLGNYLGGATRDSMARVCEAEGLGWRQIGVHGDLLPDPAEAIAEADVVIGQGRSVLDAMAGGRAAWVYGPIAGDGWVTPGTYPDLEADGFRGRATDVVVDAAAFGRDLARYRAAMGADNRKLITLHHSAYEHAIELITLLEPLVPVRPAPVGVPLEELARLLRCQYDAQSTLEATTNHLRQVREQLQATEAALADATSAVAGIEGALRTSDAELAAAREEARLLAVERDRLDEALNRVTNSRRWTATSKVLAPLDDVRRRRIP